MIFRLEYCNKDGVATRVDIETPGSSTVQAIEGTGDPFILKYTGDKPDKSLRFFTSSAEINIYETPLFNIDTLKTSSETDIKVKQYINGNLNWTGFVIPDFFSREIGGDSVVKMIASDRISTLKGVTLEDLPATLTLRDIVIRCLQKTGLDLTVKTMADFKWDDLGDRIFNARIWLQRFFDNKSRSVSCYDVLGAILTASHGRLQQYAGEWYIINKYQHEAGAGRLYRGDTVFSNWQSDIVNFSEITKGATQSIVPVAASVGVFQEHGGGRLHPDNYDFSQDLNGWTSVGGFIASINDKHVKGYEVSGSGIYEPDYDDDIILDSKYLVNNNPYQRNNNPIYLQSQAIDVPYKGTGGVKIELDVNGIGPKVYPNAPECSLSVAIVAIKDSEILTLDHGGKFIPMPANNPPVFRKSFDRGFVLPGMKAEMDTKSMRVGGTLEANELQDYKIHIRIYGDGSGRVVLFNFASLKMSNAEEVPKGVIYKTDQGGNYTKAHEIETSIFGDYMTGGLNGYFYDYPVDDTSVIHNTLFEKTSLWSAPDQADQLPLLQHVTRQMAYIFSVAHDMISGEIDITNFNPLSIFQDCNGVQYVVVSAEFDFLRSKANLQLEEIAYANNSKRDYIYSYFGEGDDGIKSIGGISSSGGGTAPAGVAGMTPEQEENLAEVMEKSHTHTNKEVLDKIKWLVEEEDETILSDENVMSSLRVIAEILSNNEELKNIFLSKIEEDEARELITFLKGIIVNGLSKLEDVELESLIANGTSTFNALVQFLSKAEFKESVDIEKGATFGNFITGLLGTGAKIDEYGHGELDSLSLRKFLEVPELRYNRTEVITGILWQTKGKGLIEDVVIDTDGSGNPLNTGTVYLKLEDGEYGAIAEDDKCMGIFHNFGGGNATEDSDDLKGNMQFAGFSTSYFLITEIVDTQKNSVFKYQLREVSSSWSKQNHPQPAMTFACYSNKYRTDRQASAYQTTDYAIMLRDMTEWEFTEANIYHIQGKLDGFKYGDQHFHGHGSVMGNAYLYGTLQGIEDIIREQIQVGGKNLLREHALQFAGKYWGGDAEWRDIDIDSLINLLTAENGKMIVTENNLLIEF